MCRFPHHSVAICESASFIHTAPCTEQKQHAATSHYSNYRHTVHWYTVSWRKLRCATYAVEYLLVQMTGIMLEEMGAIATSNNFPVIYDRMEESSCCSNLLHLFILILDINLLRHSLRQFFWNVFVPTGEGRRSLAVPVKYVIHSLSSRTFFFYAHKSNIIWNFTHNP